MNLRRRFLNYGFIVGALCVILGVNMAFDGEPQFIFHGVVLILCGAMLAAFGFSNKHRLP